jgi:replicative DNA helicase
MPNIDINDIIIQPGSERAILSIILSNHDLILECENQDLYAEHFGVKGHRYIYSAIAFLYSQSNVDNIDAMLLYNTINDAEAKQAVDELGGMNYIDSLIQSRIVNNLNIYISQVKTCALKRLAYNMGADIQDIVLRDAYSTTEELLNAIQQKTLELILNNESEAEVYRMGTNLEQRLQERARNPQVIPGLAMGWEKFDRYTKGQKSNELTVVVATSKTGKSALLMNMSKKFSIDDGVPGLYVDTEMDNEQQEDRLCSMISGVLYDELENGMWASDTMYGRAEDKIRAVNEAIEKIRNSNLYHIYMPSFTIEKVAALTRKYKLQKNIGYMIFDYIKLPTSEINGLATAQEYQRLGYMTTCLKDLAGICGIPVITSAQANRTAVGSTQLDENSIGGSYRILQMASRLIFLRNKTDIEIVTEGNRGNQKLKIAFQRNGASNVDEIDFVYERPILRMREWTA